MRIALGTLLAVSMVASALPASADDTPAPTTGVPTVEQSAAVKAYNEAKVSQIQVDEERIKAAVTAVPASNLANSATVNANAGTAEANVLASRLLRQLSHDIFTGVNVGKVCRGKNVAVFGDLAPPDFSDYGSYTVRQAGILADLEAALNLYNVNKPPKAAVPAPGGAAGGGKKVGAIPVVAALLPSLLSYLASADQSNGVTVTQDTLIVETELARVLLANSYKVKIVSVTPNYASADALNTEFKKLATDRASVANALSDYEANTPDADKRTPEQKNTIAALTKAAAEFDQFKLELLGGIGSDGKPVAPTLSLSSILKQYQAAAAMKDGSGVFVKVIQASGGLFTRKNIATFFAANPFSVSASAIVSYAAIDGATLDTVAAGTVDRIAPYQDIDKIPASSTITPKKVEACPT